MLEDMSNPMNKYPLGGSVRWPNLRRAFRNYGSENDFVHLAGAHESYAYTNELRAITGRHDGPLNLSIRATRIAYRFLNIMHDALTRVRRRVRKRARDAFTVTRRDDTRYGLEYDPFLVQNTRRIRNSFTVWDGMATPDWIVQTYHPANQF